MEVFSHSSSEIPGEAGGGEGAVRAQASRTHSFQHQFYQEVLRSQTEGKIKKTSTLSHANFQ